MVLKQPLQIAQHVTTQRNVVIRLLLSGSDFSAADYRSGGRAATAASYRGRQWSSCLLRACQPLRSASPSRTGLFMQTHHVERENREFIVIVKPYFLPVALIQRAFVVQRLPPVARPNWKRASACGVTG